MPMTIDERLDRVEQLVLALADHHTSTTAMLHPDARIRGLEETIERLGRELQASRHKQT